MGVLANLQRSFAYALRPSQFVQWIDAVSAFIDDTLAGAGQSETRYVAKDGNDTTGSGSFSSPYLTIEKAYASITDATAVKPYTIVVKAGVYTEAFGIRPFVTLVGSSKVSTILSPAQAQWLHAAWAGAVTMTACISGCTLGTNFTADFAAIGNTGIADLFLEDCLHGSNATNIIIAVTGNGVSIQNRFHVQNCEDLANGSLVGAVVHTFTNVVANLSNWFLSSNNLAYSNSTALAFSSRVAAMSANQVTVTNTGTGTYALLLSPSVVLTTSVVSMVGAGARITGPSVVATVTAPDADTTWDFSTGTVGATKLVSAGHNFILAVPTANRAWIWNNPLEGTRVTIKNLSAFYITMTGANINTVNGPCTTYLGPFDTLHMWFKSGTGWEVQNLTQQFTVPLVNGVSAFVPADLSIPNVITASLRTWNGAAGVPVALNADRAGGFRAGTGGFKISSINPATGVVVATDQGTYDVIVRKP